MKWHTVFHVIMGAVFISVVFGMLVQFVVERRVSTRSKEYWETSASTNGARAIAGTLQEVEKSTFDVVWETVVPEGMGWRLLLVWLIWTAVGVIFGMTQQNWDFTTSVYFSVTAMSTGGLQGVNCAFQDANGNCHIDDFSALFTCFFVLIGVPIFGLTMGYMGDLVSSNFASTEATVYLGQPVLDPIEISPLCILKRELVLAKWVWRRLREDYPDGPLPDLIEEKITQYVDEYQGEFIKLRDIEGELAHDALDKLAQSRTRNPPTK